VNKAGGILGRTVETIILDDASSPEQAIKNVRDLINTHKVDFIIQGASSASALGVSEVCRTAKVPVFSNSMSESVTKDKGHRYIFRAILNGTGQAYSAAWYARKNWSDKKKFYILAHDFEYGRRVSADFWKSMQKMDTKAVLAGESFVKVTEVDYSPFIAKLKGAKPEVVFTAWGSLSSFVKQATPTGVFKQIQFINPGWEIAELARLPKTDVPEGMISGGTPWYAINSPENTAFVNTITELYKVKPFSAEYFGYTSAMFGLEAIRMAKTTDKEKMIDTLEGLTLNTPAGKVTLRKIDHQSTYPFYLGRVAWSDKYGQAILENVEKVPVEEGFPTKEEIEQARKGAQ
jgi:branched-chain amino acid transport system substrate-binding protein